MHATAGWVLKRLPVPNSPIHPIAWKGCSPKFAKRMRREVPKLGHVSCKATVALALEGYDTHVSIRVRRCRCPIGKEIMSAPPATRQPAPRSALRRLVARHPVAAFLAMAYTFICIVALPPVRAHTDFLP